MTKCKYPGIPDFSIIGFLHGRLGLPIPKVIGHIFLLKSRREKTAPVVAPKEDHMSLKVYLINLYFDQLIHFCLGLCQVS